MILLVLFACLFHTWQFWPFLVAGFVAHWVNNMLWHEAGSRKDTKKYATPKTFKRLNGATIINLVMCTSFVIWTGHTALAFVPLCLLFVPIAALPTLAGILLLAFGLPYWTAVGAIILGILGIIAVTKSVHFKTRHPHPHLDQFVQMIWPQGLREAAPQLHISDTPHPNAFAFSTRGADKIAITQELQDRLSEESAQAIIAHEVRHAHQTWEELAVYAAIIPAALCLTQDALLAGIGIAVASLMWIMNWYAEYDADRWACETVGGDVYAQALTELTQAIGYTSGHRLFDTHSRWDRRIKRAQEHEAKP